MGQVINVVEYKDEGFAIIEDTSGKYIATRDSSDIIPLSDNQAWNTGRTTCALIQSRKAMLS